MSSRLIPAAVAIALIVILPPVAQAQTAEPSESDSLGGIRWTPGKPSDYGIDGAALDSLYAAMAQEPHGDLKGMVIVRGGRLISERYFNGDSVSTLHDIRSATKSLTSLLMGFAVQRGLVHTVDDSISPYLPGLPKDGKEKIKIRDLLTMRSGLDADDGDSSSPGNENTLDQSTDWIRTVYSVPMKRAPGSTYLYCSINAFLTGAIKKE